MAVRFPLRSGVLFSALAGLTLLLAPAGLAAQSTGTVTGKVTDLQTGDPVVGARLYVIGNLTTATTRTDGTYRIVLPAGAQELRVSAIGYSTARAPLTVTAGGTATQDFTLERAAIALEEIAVTGTRRTERSAIDQAVPVDVLTQEEIRLTGRTETAQILQALAPSLNFPRATIADGTDHSRPATLRGLGADQVLVLVNGKRRHTSALINVNGTVGRGQGMVDLNAIPSSAIDRIEILRDGAAAQYGSDAIAGVINIILKAGAPDELTAMTGQTAPGDGNVVNLNATKKLGWGDDGFVQLAAEFRDRGYTNRTLPDRRTQYFAGDPKNSDPRFIHQINHRQGDADTRDFVGFLNLGKQIGAKTELYSTVGWSRRGGNAPGFFRRANDNRTVRAIYPDGFLPFIHTTIYDGSAVAGLRGDMKGWSWDLSAGYGRNSFRFDIKNTANVSLGAQSPTEFYAGTLVFRQLTANLDLVKGFDVGLASPLNIAIGGEFRSDGYQIKEGEPDSWRNGGVNVLDGPNAGALPPIGAQVFPGFKPALVPNSPLPGDAVNESRNNVAGYIDLEANVSKELVLGAAARAEHYSDFGSTSDYKVSGRFEPAPGLAFRAAFSTGFRAPSLGQSWFSSTATNFVAGVPTDNRTFPVSNPVAEALGASPLKAESSNNTSAGVAFYPLKGLTLTADYYKITIKDRIVLSGTFNQPAVVTFLQNNGFQGVGGARFFTNAIDTRTAGVDIVAGYGFAIGEDAQLRLTAGFNHTKNEITHVEPTPGVLAAFSETLLDRIERTRIEKGQPRDNFNLSGILTWKDWVLNYRTQRFGEVTSFGAPADGSLDQTFRAKWISDVSVGYTHNRTLSFIIGADNVWDVYPDRNNNDGPIATNPNTTNGGNSNFGIFPYNGISPFGFNGRFAYIKVSWGY
jgi:iron complex outermembrane recepter protein